MDDEGVASFRAEEWSPDVLHALGAAGPVAIVEVEALALQDEGAHAILPFSVSVRPDDGWRCGKDILWLPRLL